MDRVKLPAPVAGAPLTPRRHAAVTQAQIVIGASADRVWRLLTEVEHWPAWNAAVGTASLPGPLERGSVFVWTSQGFTIRSTVQEVEPQRRLTWTGAAFGTRAFHAWDLQPVGDRVIVTTHESFDGWLPRLFKGAMQRKLDGSLPAWLRALKEAAER